jgi:hypothetical protein
MNLELFEIVKTAVNRPTKEPITVRTPKVTGKG